MIYYQYLHYPGLVLAALGTALAVDTLIGRSLPEYEVRGRRAGNRLRALRGGSLAALQPFLRLFTSYAATLRWSKTRAQIEVWLRQGDHPMGLVPSEVLGFCGLAATTLGVLVGTQFNMAMGGPAFLLGLYLPYDQIRNRAEQRLQAVTRSLPVMADLLVLSMEAGMDFVSSVRLLVAKSSSEDGRLPIRDELLVFLHQLQLGRTRRYALKELATRVPTEPVRSFTTAVIQAEERGMPLREVLRIQAEVLRHRRIQTAEAYIDTANLKMLIPIMLVIIALLGVIIVPTVIGMSNQIGGGGIP